MYVRPLFQEDPLEEVMAIHSSILAWRMPWTEEPGAGSGEVVQETRGCSEVLAFPLMRWETWEGCRNNMPEITCIVFKRPLWGLPWWSSG